MDVMTNYKSEKPVCILKNLIDDNVLPVEFKIIQTNKDCNK